MRSYHLALYITETAGTHGHTMSDIPGLSTYLAELAGVERVLEWNGSDYVSRSGQSVKARTDVVKRFIGPTDPATVSGVVLGANDAWDHT